MLAARGEVGILEASGIATAVAWEKHGMLASRWLRRSYGELNHEQRLTFSREVAKAATERDRALRRLPIQPADGGDTFASLMDKSFGPQKPAIAVESTGD